jgi:prepilin-type processing-associated H-X9-DG protein
MKQVSLAVLQYVQDADEKYPMGVDQNWDWQTTWPFLTQPYIKSTSVYRCPDDSATTAADWFDTVQQQSLSYAGNAYTPQTPANTGPGFAHGIFAIGQSWSSPLSQAISAVTQPAATIMIAEKHTDDNVAYAASMGTGPILNAGPGTLIAGIPDGGWDKFGGCQYIPNQQGTVGPHGAPGTYCDEANGAVSYKHSGHTIANFAFSDGHVKAMRPSATNPDPINQPQNNLWDALR